jgi:AraC-like DNA-binding protein
MGNDEGGLHVFTRRRDIRAMRREAILKLIEERSAESGLSAATVAALLGITPRYVHLLLEETGKSFTITFWSGGWIRPRHCCAIRAGGIARSPR